VACSRFQVEEGSRVKAGRSLVSDDRQPPDCPGPRASLRLFPPPFLLLHDGDITLAGGNLQARPVFDLDFTANVGDELFFLQETQGYGHARPAHSKHVRQEFLGEADLAPAEAILAHQQPSGQPLVGVMQPVARSDLRRLHADFLAKLPQALA